MCLYKLVSLLQYLFIHSFFFSSLTLSLPSFPIFPSILRFLIMTIFNSGYYLQLGFTSGSDGKESACNPGDLGWSLGWEDLLEKGMATHSLENSPWRILGTEEPDRLQFMGSQGTEQLTHTHTHTHTLLAIKAYVR